MSEKQGPKGKAEGSTWQSGFLVTISSFGVLPGTKSFSFPTREMAPAKGNSPSLLQRASVRNYWRSLNKLCTLSVSFLARSDRLGLGYQQHRGKTRLQAGMPAGQSLPGLLAWLLRLGVAGS